jgi:hypothetical protein
MTRVLFGLPEWIPHPSFWSGNLLTTNNNNFNQTIPWETAQLNLTSDGVLDYTFIETEDPPQFIPYEFEVYDWKGWGVYAFVNWDMPFLAGAFYLFLIFSLKLFMRNREPMNLKWPLFIWNAVLSIFSIIGFIRTAPEFFTIIFGKRGLYQAICYR